MDLFESGTGVDVASDLVGRHKGSWQALEKYVIMAGLPIGGLIVTLYEFIIVP